MTQKNNSLALAQQLLGTGAVLGAITPTSAAIYTLDNNLYSPPFPIWQTNPDTGAFIPPSIPAPSTTPNNPFGLNMAYDGTYIYYNNGSGVGTNTIYKIDAATGQVVAQATPPSTVPLLGGIAYLNGELYGIAAFNSDLYLFDPSTLAFQSTITTGIGSGYAVEGLAGNSDNGMLYAIAQGAPGTFFELNPSTGAVVATAPDNNQGLNEQDMAYQNGQLFVSDTNGLGSSGGTNVIDVYDATTFAFLRRMPVATQGFVSGLAGDGLGVAPSPVSYYSVNANAGDNLHFATSTPAGGPNEFVNNLYPELLLYDPNGNLVAVAAGNGSDGRNSVIDFTVPQGDAGQWIIEVAQSPNTSAPTFGEYGLTATGATGTLAPFTVTAATPAPGALIQPPSTVTISFNQSVFIPSLTAGELEVNGVAATGFTVDNATTVTWAIPSSAYGTGVDLANVVTLGADASGNQVTDISGQTLIPFSYTFFTTNVAPTVVSSSVDGQVFSPAPANITDVVTFSQPMNTTFTTDASFQLYGQYRNQVIAAASFSWDPTGTILTINFAKVPDDVYTLTLFASGFENVVGIPLASNYVSNFTVTLGTAAFPTPLTSIPPLGDLIYTGSDSHVLATSTDVNSLTLALNAGESLTLIGTPSAANQQLVITVLNPGGTTVATATALAPGQNVVIENAPAATTGTYTIQISDSSGNLGLYSIQAYLNSYVKQGTSNDTIGTAQNINPSSYTLSSGSNRLGLVGSLPAGTLQPGDAFVVSQGTYFTGTSNILVINEAGQVINTIPINLNYSYTVGEVKLSPYNNELYVGLTTSNPFVVPTQEITGELLELDPVTGKLLNTINLPADPWINGNPNFYYFYPFAFDAATDGTFWISQPDSNNIIHVDGSGNVLASYSTGSILPYSPTVRPDGEVYFTSNTPNAIFLLDPNTGNISQFASQPNPQFSNLAGTGGLWSADFYNGAQRFDSSGNLLQSVGYYGSTQAQNDPSGNVWVSNDYYQAAFLFDSNGNQLQSVTVPNAEGLAVWGVDNPNPPAQDTQDYYSFSLTAGQSATLVAKSLNSLGVQISLVDGNGNVLATGVSGASNVDSSISNFVAPTTGTYYVKVTGAPGVQYSVAVTRGATFELKPNGTQQTAQPITGNGVLGAATPGGTLVIGNTFQGIDFASPNNPCGCLPPDTNAAVGPTQVIETVNEEIRVWDKTTGATVLDESLASFFGQGSFGDVYVLYDNTADRFYVTAFDGSATGLLLAISKDSNALDGWLPTYNLNVNGGAGTPDYPKPGFNKDAIFVDYNDFSGSGDAKIATINKAAAFAGTLQMYISTPAPEFRAMTPAQMNGDTTGGTEWFFSTDGNDVSGNTMRVTAMTNYFSTTPTYTYYSIPVTPYQAPAVADQPGGSWTTFPNTTTYSVQYLNGMLVTAMASGTAADGYTYPKGLYYEVNVASGTPVLVNQGVIDPGPGVSVQMPSVAMDRNGNLGFTWMEASSTEYLSMWIGSLDNQGHFSSYDVSPGGGFFYQNSRIGDYSTVALDPTSNTFWAANEYIGSDGASDIWRTYIASFSLPPAVDNNWYSVDVQSGQALSLQTSTPSDQGGQFINTASLEIELYDTFGNLVAVGTKLADGRNEALFYNAPVTGQYFVHLYNDPGTSGEYFLSATTKAYASGGISGQVYNDLSGSGSQTPADPGLDHWEINVYTASNQYVASQLTYGGGYFDIAGLAPGRYKVSEVLMNGWTETQPSTLNKTYTVTVAANQTTSGLLFGNFQNVTIAGTVFNDLTGIGSFLPGDPGLSGWTVKLISSAGKTVATTTSDANGNYTFANVGPARSRSRKRSRMAGFRPCRQRRARTASPPRAARTPAACCSATSSS